MRPSKYRIGRSLDPSLLERVEKIFEGENLVEMVLHAHLLIERALTSRIAEKMFALKLKRWPMVLSSKIVVVYRFVRSCWLAD